MRIGTWNVDYARASRLAALRQVLTTQAADIWVLTETNDDLVPPRCPFVLHSSPRPKHECPSKTRPGSRWVSIWSKYEIIADVSLPRADHERTTCALLNLGEGRTMLVYGTVMPWRNDPKFRPSERPLVISAQCEEWRELKQNYSSASLCVAGDFNTDMGTGSYYGTKKDIATLRAGLAACGAFCVTEPSRFPSGLLVELPIDHIALQNASSDSTLMVTAWPADKKTHSDHSGVTVEIAASRPRLITS